MVELFLLENLPYNVFMDLAKINSLKQILKENRLWAKKSFGQNFLVAEEPLIKMIETSQITADDTVVEIGPGLGVLTEELGQRAKLVLAIETDYDFVEFLRKRFKSHKNIKIIHADILRYAICDMQLANYKVVANLPYNITSPVIRKFLESGGDNDSDIASFSATHSNPTQHSVAGTSFSDNPCHTPDLMILMVQKEVAERICAKPGNSSRGLLTVMVEFYAQAEIVEIVDRESFWPIPKVDSAIIKFSAIGCQLSAQNIDPKIFFRIVKAGFSQKRRQIHHPLQASLHLEKSAIYDILEKAKIDPKLRAEDLSLEDWIKLYQEINKLT